MSGAPFTPARYWRAFLFLACAALAIPLAAAPAARTIRPSPHYVQFGQPDQAEGARILRGFRGMGIAGDYFLDFKLRVMPRRGAEREFTGRLWGSRNEQGAISRVNLNATPAGERRLLLQNGTAPAVWEWTAATGAVAPLAIGSLFEPLIAGTELTIFDLQMPYLYWEDFVFEGVSKIRGRPAHTFLLYPPADFTAAYPALTGVRVHLDTQFNAMVQAELIGAGDRAIKTLAVLDLKKVGEQWMVKTIDLRNEQTRDKTRFQVTAVALNLELAPPVFEPAELEAEVAPPIRLTLLGP
jgi:hypothetical protein